MNIAYRFRIYPNREQEVLLAKTFGCCRFLYNQMLNDKIREYEATKKMLRNTPAMYKKAYPFLKEVDSLALANVQMHLEKAYKNFFRNPKIGFPKCIHWLIAFISISSTAATSYASAIS